MLGVEIDHVSASALQMVSHALIPVQVGLAAAEDSQSDDGGISVVTSNPVRLSNPISLSGGNYQGQLNGALG